MRKFSLPLLALAAISPYCVATETQYWQQNSESDFAKGSRKNVSLRGDGSLSLAPAVGEVFDASLPYLWTAARDSKGNVYVAGGGTDSGATPLFMVDAQGKSRTLAKLDGLEIHALAVDRRDRLFAATAPDGKVYQVAADGKTSVFFDPKAKYIWALAFDGKGDLFVATGMPGRIFRVKPDGVGSVYFETDENNARSLAIDAKGDLIAGTEPGGLIERITPAADGSRGAGFVLYQTPGSEVTAVAFAPNGDIYAAAVGSRGAGAPASMPAMPPVAPGSLAAPASATPSPGGEASRAAAATPVLHLPMPAGGGSEVFRIAAGGAPLKVWTNPQATVYAIAFDAEGRPLLGTGNKGAIYRIESPSLSTLLADLPPTQITAFTQGGGNLYAVTGNVGKLYRIGPGRAPEGEFESEVFDAGSFSRWGRLTLRAAPAAGLSVFSRSGNLDRPQRNWSEWAPVPLSGDSGRIASPASRFLQYKLVWRGEGSAALDVGSVSAAWLARNIAPEVRGVEATPANYRFPPPMLSFGQTAAITLPPVGSPRRSPAGNVQLDLGGGQTMSYAKGFVGVRWSASDANGDALVYKLEIRGVNETAWRPLKDKLREKAWSWDGTAFADGEYVVRVTASDAPSNPPAQALEASLESEAFPIDNTAPGISGLAVSAGAHPTVHWLAHDSLGTIHKAEYSIDGGDWQVVEPLSGLSDSHDEEYRLPVDRPLSGERVVAVRVTDDADNEAVATLIVK